MFYRYSKSSIQKFRDYLLISLFQFSKYSFKMGSGSFNTFITLQQAQKNMYTKTVNDKNQSKSNCKVRYE